MKVVVDVPVGPPDATRVVHLDAHRGSFLLAGLPRWRLGAFAAPRAFCVHLEFGRLLRHLIRTHDMMVEKSSKVD